MPLSVRSLALDGAQEAQSVIICFTAVAVLSLKLLYVPFPLLSPAQLVERKYPGGGNKQKINAKTVAVQAQMPRSSHSDESFFFHSLCRFEKRL